MTKEIQQKEQRFLHRFEFIEILVRIAQGKYIDIPTKNNQNKKK